ncbi:hypothetical protein M758_1G217800 [Ceratodon purpureus]|uniref:ATP synthase F0 subunit 8 n=1 Tax=Ceratodon purpureus TaxID=3225 RepID=A0A8T0JA45_CERPU|nr:hypothetical protein KC19_1G202400 [Ceratodon purpureus]KAG0630973.1 hypothetical protein M758_1G217800 [Ceratodon purpureus]
MTLITNIAILLITVTMLPQFLCPNTFKSRVLANPYFIFNLHKNNPTPSTLLDMWTLQQT